MCADGFVRAVIRKYPLSVAEGIMQQKMDIAMQQVVNNNKAFFASSIDRVVYDNEKNVKAIETDTAAVTLAKTEFSSQLGKVLKEYGNDIEVDVPLGTIIGNEYTVGRGPKIHFKIRYSLSVTTKIESKFKEAGINNSLHSVEMQVTGDLFLLIPWGEQQQKIETNYILSETVISGKVPEAYTNVYDSQGNIADDIFNYGAELD